MKLKHMFGQIGKMLLAGGIALAVLTIFCSFYYNVPTHQISESGVTNYRWEENVGYIELTEGFGWGKTNNEGYMNAFDYEGQAIDILIMGSSHMEAKQVPMSQSVAGRLGTLFPDETVYNIGISGHDFLVCCGNFEAAIDTYKPTDYIIIETSALSFAEWQEDNVLNEKETPYEPHDGIVGKLQENHFLRWTYTQLEKFLGRLDWPFDNKLNPIVQVQKAEEGPEQSPDTHAPTRLLEHIGQIVSDKTDATVIIVYHPAVAVNTDGSLNLAEDGAKSDFAQACEDNGIIFLDMSERFTTEYETNHVLPHGFANSSIGSGHLNRHGNAMIADELYNMIKEDS